MPGWGPSAAALRRFPKCTLVSRRPELLLIQMDGEGKTGQEIVESLGMEIRTRI
jgi:hypothetical protein